MAEKSKKKISNMKKSHGLGSKSKEQLPSDTKKPPMKTASDVISRLLWDDSLPQDKFVVGYLDRFDGIVEKSFASLDWRDPSIVDNYTLALPKHRIQYFKYNNRKVWDKKTRKDIVFGSTGYPRTIYEFISAVEQEQLDFCEEDLEPIGHGGNNKMEISDLGEANNEDYDRSDRSNFFIAVRIKNDDIIKNLREVSDYMKERDELLGECCVPPEMYHLTLSILKLDSPGDVCKAVSAMQSLLSKDLPSVTIELEGLDNFRHRVLFSRILENEELLKLRKMLVDELVSREVTITDKFSFVPHVTIAKLSRPASRFRSSKYIDQYLYLKFEDNEFGHEKISNVCLCEMGVARREDGFYPCATEISLP